MQIITDSSCDIPRELIEKYDILVVPLSVEIDGQNYVDGIEITHQEFLKRCPTPMKFQKHHNRHHKVL